MIQLTKQQRGDNNYRIYDGRILQELSFIKQLKSVGFTLNEIKDFRRMDTLDMISCEKIGPLVKDKLLKIETQLKTLTAQKQKLLNLMDACQGDCSATIKTVDS